MSGFAVAFGKPSKDDVEAMMKKIEYRGPAAGGIAGVGNAVVGQNYLAADGLGEGQTGEFPLADPAGSGLRICYDGQMGNWPDLAGPRKVPDGPLKEERLLLDMYGDLGPDMLDKLGDTLFSFVITDGEKLFAARDLLGIKTMFYGRKDGTLYLSPELKAIAEITDDVQALPAGHYMDETGEIRKFTELPSEPPPQMDASVEQMTADIRDIIERSLRNRVDFLLPVSSLLSGGIDSSVIAFLTNKIYREKLGGDAVLKTYSLGVGVSGDILNARLVAEMLGTEHHELIIDIGQIMDVLPKVIYYLESFDPSLVRSSVSNYLISKMAVEGGANILMSGEGGDEVFCGYLYLKDYPYEKQFEEQIRCMKFLHHNASLRLDRMNMCNSVKVVAPMISGELLDYALRIPPKFKQYLADNGEKVEKWILRKAFENDLPEEVVWRLKQEFSQGSGSADVLPSQFDKLIQDDELKEVQEEYPIIRSKEELYYFRLFREHFSSPKAIKTVGQWETI